MPLALFDLDNTLLSGDSDHSWGEFMVEEGMVNAATYKNANDQFFEDYKAGSLDMQAYLQFSLSAMKHYEMDFLLDKRRKFLREKIMAYMQDKAIELVNQHHHQHR